MPEKIKSLDELEKDEIVDIRTFGPCIVAGICEIPEHEKSAEFYPLYSFKVKDSDINYEKLTIRESEIKDFEINKLERKNYAGWRYKAVRIVGE